MDAGALEEAVGIALARLAEDGADLIVLNKFGLSETQGRGFRALIVDALGRDVPVLVGLTDATNLPLNDLRMVRPSPCHPTRTQYSLGARRLSDRRLH